MSKKTETPELPPPGTLPIAAPAPVAVDAPVPVAVPGVKPMQAIYMAKRIAVESDTDYRTTKAAILDGDFSSTTARVRIGATIGALKFDAAAIAKGLRSERFG